jgi:hypothetical protein
MVKFGMVTRSPQLWATVLAATLATAAAAQSGDEEGAAAASEIRECLPHPTIDRTKILNDRNIVFVTRNGTIYNNELPKQCPTLRRNSLVNYPIANGRQCAGDRFQVLWETSPGRYQPSFVCQLGNFRSITENEYDDLLAMTDQSRDRRRRGRSSREAVTTEQVELPRAAEAPSAEAPAAAE